VTSFDVVRTGVATSAGRPGSSLPGRSQAFDALFAAVLLLFGLVGTQFAAQNQPTARPVDALGLTFVGIAAAALATRRRWPLATLAVVTAATTTSVLMGYPYGPIMISFAVAVYTVAAVLPLRTSAIAGGVAMLAIAAHIFVSGNGNPGLTGLFPAIAFVAVPFAVGYTRATAARARADRAQKLADDERLRVAQEVHDVVGHGLAAIHMQAEIALHLLARKPEQAESALTAISRTSKEALDELKVTLAVLRHGDGRAPAPGLAQLPDLRERLAHAGLPVTLDVSGDAAGTPVPVAVDLAAYRVVQESLTNVLRHAGTATASVVVSHSPSALAVTVTDTGRGGVVAGEGTGLAGMRERVTALGGSFAAGPRAGGGFEVRASLPLGSPS
jgi:signal transduction histidine kinase